MASPRSRSSSQTLSDSATDAWRVATDGRLEELLEQDVPDEPARFGAVAPALVYAPDIIAVSQDTGRSIPAVTRAFFTVGERLYLDLVEARAAALPAEDRWQRMAWDTLLDDLRLLRRQIVERVIAESQNGSIDDAVDVVSERAVRSVRPPVADDGERHHRAARRQLDGDGGRPPDPPGRCVEAGRS